MNVFVVLSLDSGLPVFHKQTVPGQKTKNSQSVEESQRAERDIMHVTSLLYALRKIASSIDHQEQTRGSGRHRLGHLHHMQQGTEHVYSYDFFLENTTYAHFCVAMIVNQVDYSTDFGCYLMKHIAQMLVEDDSVVSLLLQDNQNQQNQSNKKIWKTFLDQTLPSLAWQRMHNILLSAQDEHELSVQFLASKQTVQSMFPTAAGNKSPTESNSASSPNTSAIQSPSRKEEIRIGEEDLSQREEVASSSWCCFGSTAAVDPSSSRGKKTSIVTVQSRNAPASASIPYSPAKSTHSRGSDAYDEHDGDCVVVAFPSCSQPPADRSDLVMWYNAIMAVIYQQLDGHLHRSTTNGELKSTKIQIMDSNLNLSFKVMQSRPLPHIPAGHQNNPRQAMREFGESNSTLQPASVKKKEELMMISLDEDDGLQSKSIDIKPTTSTDPTAAEVSIFRPNQDNDLIFYLLDCHDMLGLVRCRNHTMMSHGLQSILQEVSQVGRWLLWCLQQHYIAVDASVLGGDSKTQASSNPSRNSNSRLIYCHDKEANRDIHKCVGEMYLESELQ